MLWAIIQMEKLAALRCRFLREGLLHGSTAAHFASNQGEESELDGVEPAGSDEDGGSDDEDANQEKQGVEGHLDDAGPENGPPSLLSIMLVATPGISKVYVQY